MKKLLTIACFLLSFAVIFLTIFNVCKKPGNDESFKGILRLWNIDSFEGGKGSRTTFLNNAAREYEKKHDGVYIMINGVSSDGFSYAADEGNIPDMLSFSFGADVSGYAVKLVGFSFVGGEINGSCYAYPWCKGGYLIYSLDENFSSITYENTVISSGGNNLPLTVAALSGMKGDFTVKNSTSAYIEFLNGKYQYMIGTQRDFFRFQTRGVSVYAKPLDAYNDLYQYISILNGNEEVYDICLDFITFLTSENMQKKLKNIGMSSEKYYIYGGEQILSDTERIKPSYILSAFTGRSSLNKINETASEILVGGDIKNLKKYLKNFA